MSPVPAFYVGVGGLNLGPQAFMASVYQWNHLPSPFLPSSLHVLCILVFVSFDLLVYVDVNGTQGLGVVAYCHCRTCLVFVFETGM